MHETWQIQEAKNKLSEVIQDAQQIGPQVITRHGTPVAVVLSMEQYSRIQRTKDKLSRFFQNSPLKDLELERDKSPLRPLDHL